MVDTNQTQASIDNDHDWTFFVFIAIVLILLAAAFTWASVKSGMFANQQTQSESIHDKLNPELRP